MTGLFSNSNNGVAKARYLGGGKYRSRGKYLEQNKGTMRWSTVFKNFLPKTGDEKYLVSLLK